MFLVRVVYIRSYLFSPHCPGLEALSHLGHVNLLEVLRVLVTQLKVAVLNRLFDSLFAAQPDNGTDALLDAPRCSNTCHADVVLLRDLFHALDDLLVDSIFPLVDECIEKFVALCAA
jgi:hypothetical protein